MNIKVLSIENSELNTNPEKLVQLLENDEYLDKIENIIVQHSDKYTYYILLLNDKIKKSDTPSKKETVPLTETNRLRSCTNNTVEQKHLPNPVWENAVRQQKEKQRLQEIEQKMQELNDVLNAGHSHDYSDRIRYSDLFKNYDL